MTEPRRTTPRPLQASLDALLDDLDSAPVQATNSLLARWPEVVGRDLAAHTEPIGVRHGVLVVQADDPAYGEHLSWQERQLVQRLATVLGEGIVTGLQVKIRTA